MDERQAVAQCTMAISEACSSERALGRVCCLLCHPYNLDARGHSGAPASMHATSQATNLRSADGDSAKAFADWRASVKKEYVVGLH